MNYPRPDHYIVYGEWRAYKVPGEAVPPPGQATAGQITEALGAHIPENTCVLGWRAVYGERP